ncbi:unnamed protein product [Chrysoparadoxa australica]
MVSTISIETCPTIGFFLRAARGFREGDVILREIGDIQESPTMHTIQMGKDSHVLTPVQSPLRLAEHMCEPNCVMKMEPEGQDGSKVAVSLVAIKAISEGDRIGFNYNTTDWVGPKSQLVSLCALQSSPFNASPPTNVTTCSLSTLHSSASAKLIHAPERFRASLP